MGFIIRVIWNYRRLWRGLFYWLVLPVVLLYVGSNIVLNTYVKGRVVRSLEARTSQDWEIGTLNWTPNGNIHVHDVRAILGDGDLTVKSVLLQPNWTVIRQKRLSFTSIELDKPSLDVSNKWLLSQVEHVKDPSTVDDTPALANNDQGEVAQIPDKSVDSTPAGSKPATGSGGSVASLPKTGVKPTANAKPKQETEYFEYDAWLKVSDARVLVRSDNEKFPEILNLKGITASIPYGGKDLEGEVLCEQMHLIGRSVLTDANFLVQKKRGILSLKETDVDFLGVEMKPRFQLIRGRDGMYFYADLEVPKQNAALVVKHLDLSVGAEVEELQARVQGGGRLDKPLSWRGLFGIQASRLNVAEGHRGGLVEFDNINCSAHLNRGVVRVERAEVMSEDLSLMANGVFTMNARGFGVVRVVTSPEKRGWIDKLCKGSGFFGEFRSSFMRPLNSVDRYYTDLQLDGSLFQPMMKLDQVTDWQPVWPAVGRLIQFVKDEREEEILQSN